jgi:hypothetical protein
LNVVTIAVLDSGSAQWQWTVAVHSVSVLSLHERVIKNKEILSHDGFKPGALGVIATAVTVWSYICIRH